MMKNILQNLISYFQSDTELSTHFSYIAMREASAREYLVDNAQYPFLIASRGGEKIKSANQKDHIMRTYNVKIFITSRGFDTDEDVLYGNGVDKGILDISDSVVERLFHNPTIHRGGTNTVTGLNHEMTITDIQLIQTGVGGFIGGREINLSYYIIEPQKFRYSEWR